MIANYFSSRSLKVGILGGGQLGKMLLDVARRYDLYTRVLDPSPDAPCSTGCKEFIPGSFRDYDTVLNFGLECDIVTIEIEGVNTKALKELHSRGIKVYPQPEIIELIQNKVTQKQFYTSHSLPTAPWQSLSGKTEISKKLVSGNLKLPFVWKSATGGYDGRGVLIVRDENDIGQIPDVPALAEEFADLASEIAIVVGRGHNGQLVVYPPVEMSFNPEANLVEYVFCPATIPDSVLNQATTIARNLVEHLGIVGLLAVEMFLTRSGQIWINESAPRVHNSAHLTIEGCITSQFEQHLRTILGFPLGSTQLVRPAVMVNLTGEKGFSGPVYYEGAEDILAMEGAYIHLYGKTETRPFRKMGHVTITAPTIGEAREKARKVRELFKVKST